MIKKIHDKSGKYRRRTSLFLPVLAILILASGLSGCDLFKMFFGSPEEKEQVQGQILNTISSMITDVTQTLTTRGIAGLTPDSVAAISSTLSKMANDAVALSRYLPDDL